MQVFVEEDQWVKLAYRDHSCTCISACIVNISTVFRQCFFIIGKKILFVLLYNDRCFKSTIGVLPALHPCYTAPVFELKDCMQHLEESLKEDSEIPSRLQRSICFSTGMENNRYFSHDSIFTRAIWSDISKCLLGFALQNTGRKQNCLETHCLPEEKNTVKQNTIPSL